VTHERAGLGSSTTPHYNKATRKDRRVLVQDEVQASLEEQRSSRMVGMQQQGAWTRWEQAVECKVSWAELWKSEPHQIKFLIKLYQARPTCSAGGSSSAAA